MTPPDEPIHPVRPMRGAARILHDILDDLSQTNAAVAGEGQGVREEAGAEQSKARLGDLIDRLDERAFGLMLLLLALPCSIPFIYILPQIVALPMLALAGQMAAGRHHPWLPASLHEREFSPSAFQKVVVRSEKYLGWIERFARPRLKAVTGNLGARIVGALLLVPAASILVPLPSTNTVPGIGVAITSLGLIERDGILVIFGLLIGFVWVGLLVFLGFEMSQIIKDWISATF
jgi:hypothetical protein